MGSSLRPHVSRRLSITHIHIPFANVETVISGEAGPAPLALKACTMIEYLVDFRNCSMMYSNFRWANGLPFRCCVLKLLFSRSRKEDADEKEDEVDPEMMMEDEIDTPDEDKGGEPDDDDEGGFLSLAPDSALPAAVPAAAVAVAAAGADPAGCIGTCIVLYVKGSEEAEKRYAM